jgi:HK97 family phage major capsid protein/HK97 family phage prohead protease
MPEAAAPAQARTIKPGSRVERVLTLTREAINEEARTCELAFSSETPIERWWGVEILDHRKGAVRLNRLKAGGPLLMDHDMRDHVGVIESVQIGADRVGRAVVRFGKSARANEVFADVLDGIRRSVSVGYMIHKAVLESTDKDAGTDTYRITDWEPYEVSMVATPADITAGVGRAADAPAIEFVAVESPAAAPVSPHLSNRSIAMDEVVTTPAAAPAAAPAAPAIGSTAVADAVAKERALVRDLQAIGETFEKFGGRALAVQAIEKGWSTEQLRSHIMNAMTAAQTTPAPQLGLSNQEQQRFSLFKAIRALTDKTWKGAEFELECHNAILKRTGLPEAVHGGFYLPADIQKRDLTVGTANAGGNLVGTNLLPGSFIDLLRARSVVAGLGAVMLGGLVGNVAVPKLTGAATAYWLTNEATAITESQQTFGQLALAPKNLGAYTELSRQLMLQSTPAAEQLVMNDLAKVLALAIDLAALEGSGASGQPTGISQTAGIGSVTGTSIDYAKVLEFQTDVAAGNALAGSSAYVTTPAVAGLLMQRQRFSSTDTPLWTGSVLEGLLAGHKATTTTQVTAASMVFGDFANVVIGEWGMLEIALNPFASFVAAITGIRAIQSVDVGIRHAAAFSRATSIT